MIYDLEVLEMVEMALEKYDDHGDPAVLFDTLKTIRDTMSADLNRHARLIDEEDGQPSDLQEHENFAHDNEREGEYL